MAEPLSVALVWHMHQPYYREDDGGRFLLPWVRLRASKDYARMVETAGRFPNLRITMNWVPTLLEQLEQYASGEVEDSHRELSLREASEVSPAERSFLARFTRAADHPRSTELLGPFYTLLESLQDPAGDIDDQTLRDLQVWSMLAWLDPGDIERDPALSAIARRGAGFDEEVKRIVDERQMARVRAVLPALRKAVAAGGIEPMTSPYSHPILPLLIDQESARVARPDIELPPPDLRFQRPDDAAAQIALGLETFARLGGASPQGMWPSECAVSPAAAEAMASAGVRWAVSDEGVLARSLERSVRGDPDAMARLYTPHRDASGLHLVFRDAVLSNRIGFDYPRLRAQDAVADLVGSLEDIARAKPADDAWLVVIALDGENCWDYYENNGAAFLDGVYQRLSSHPMLQTEHVGAFIDAHPGAVRELDTLWSGSWIDADLTTWIGEPAHTRAWELLARARSALDGAPPSAGRDQAMRQALIAEGSDWFWWFSSRHESGIDAAWDALFRAHLRRVHELLGQAPPDDLETPILQDSGDRGDLAPLRPIDPQDGGGDGEWRAAGTVWVADVYGAMQPARGSVDRIDYGCSETALHLRIGTSPSAAACVVAHLDGAAPLSASRGAWTLALPLAADGAAWWLALDEPGRGEQRVPARGQVAVRRGRGDPVVIVAAECAPLAVAGDLAASVRATLDAVIAAGRPCVVILPHHRALRDAVRAVRIDSLALLGPPDAAPVRVLQAELAGAAVLTIDAPEYFDRAQIYGEPDDALRYTVFARAAAQVIEAAALRPSVVHGFEWESAVTLAMAAVGTPTVLSVNGAGVGQQVDASVLAGVRGDVSVPGSVIDLLELGRQAATRVMGIERDAAALDAVYRSVEAQVAR